MGVNLQSKKSQMVIDNFAWAMLRTLAEANGWVPQGTTNPDPSLVLPKNLMKLAPELNQNWPGFYHTRNRQTVSGTDGNHMADALRAGIQRIEDGGHDADLMEMFFPEEVRKHFREIPPAHEVRKYIIELAESFMGFSKDAPFIIG